MTIGSRRQRRSRLYQQNNGGNAAQAFVRTGLTAFFDSTKQDGTEGFVLETIAGNNATHHNAPTWDATHKLWTYNGTKQSSTVSVAMAPFGRRTGAARMSAS